MSIVDKAFETQLNNIQKRTGKTLDELYEIIRKSGLAKHGEIVSHAQAGAGHGARRCEHARQGLHVGR